MRTFSITMKASRIKLRRKIDCRQLWIEGELKCAPPRASGSSPGAGKVDPQRQAKDHDGEPSDERPRPMTQADYSPDAPHQAIEFLRQLRPNGPWLLVAIEPDGGRIRAVTAQNAEEVTAFVQQYNDRWNLYYSLNPTRAINRKPKKKDIAAIEYVFSDLDPEEDETSEQAKTR